MEKIGTSTPVNKCAALVTGKGYQYIPDKKIQTSDSDTPIPTRDATDTEKKNPVFQDLTGCLWVVRCQCGTYSKRRKKAILNPENVQDRCEQCRHLAFLRRTDVYLRTGKNPDIRNF